jgi:hypothetical protein
MSLGKTLAESGFVRQVKHLVEAHLSEAERAAVRAWLHARFDSSGYRRTHLEAVPDRAER